MLKQNELIGACIIYRQEIRPFTDKQIEILKNFARQRTTDLTERTADLTEALEQQTATSEVLQVISSSPGDLEPVFQAMLENATRICEAKFGVVFSFDGNEFHFEAQVGTPPELAEYNRAGPMPQPLPGSHLDRLRQTKRVSYTADYAAEGIPAPPVTLGGARSTVDVPMLKDNELVGAFSIYRQEVRPFTDKQIDLVKNFAAQAVIAIENARLLNELRQRTTDLSEALEQQTATSEVLQVISSSPGDLEPVFAAILNNAVRICAALNATLWSFENGRFHFLARYSDMPGSVSDPSVSDPIQPGPNSGLGRVRSTKQIVHITDYAAEPAYLERDPFAVRVVEELGIRTNLSVPMLQDNELVGAFSIYRTTVKPFSEKQIELITGFAAQAVIAIENARLLNELRQRTTELTVALEQQTATADVLKVISRSQFDLQLVLDNLIKTATSLCGAKRGVIFRRDGDLYRAAAFYNATPELIEFVRSHPIAPGRHTITARVALERRVIHVDDLQEDTEYTYALRDTEPIRTELGVPMFRGDDLVGVFILYKLKVDPFTDKQIDLVTTFADQAVIAIENVRLLNELRQRTGEVEKLNQHLEQRVADQVNEIERMGRLRRFLPPQVADLIVASGSEKQLESHRREITALFCDLRGFTGFTETSLTPLAGVSANATVRLELLRTLEEHVPASSALTCHHVLSTCQGPPNCRNYIHHRQLGCKLG
jgi:GAF domain-containing protein